MANDDSKPPPVFERVLQERDDLEFLRDEGLELLALFKTIRDPARRDLVKALIRALADEPPAH